MAKKNALTAEQREELLGTLKIRFEENIQRHDWMQWDEIQKKLETQPDKLWSLHEMERTGGEPDVLEFDETTSNYVFYDCSPESPSGRRSICYDQKALDARKKNKPDNNALSMATAMGIELLSEDQYRVLQKHGSFDLKTSSWVLTPKEIRDLGGALFCDFRYGQVFLYHNGADSYYGARGFRGFLRV
ncbi:MULTISPECIES: DUF4256 domain-containing protein [Planococcus]|uniref:DUF4256 domain-containing protein n=1 Tax=Planococcus faecalis TaxID=1598147 RepID=A0ABN4XFU2_9BACL|nr:MULTISPECIES: DUF4256 domain-containing protein [Planococcus]AQU78506.1 hypothetical protein AJGP001_03980 [Planococcus faecalis]MDJ0331530.1 DUF4256 domain-containing protein [Planococcus sp. S3-L1]OHX51489.1 hypothetical protein BB777_16785 [Planococcus faecalis]